MKVHASLVFSIAVLFLAVQGIDRPKIAPTLPPTIQQSGKVPGPVKAVVDRSCKDCHSAETAWPWYSRIAPVSWLIEQDVREGRKRLDFSKWTSRNSMGPSVGDAEQICGAASSGDMPPKSYRFMHPKSKLTSEDVAVFCQWADELSSKSASSR